ncbi:2-oxoglutarate dehydrogenase complex dihydrolipoyllysine-residue succinyltransferase [Marinivivus vitaminiproducens]|uniref:2-oxoglutarate dehydrogenase complex dihydrolipoyllysine-residue succinyltransferase n=1 Tax=Marinivivus vitaminiproducens TaxID=3035935 RepID=UPI00279E6231|nr:2-oxoglutarate dehydrogenase complex dihydrolipoyllysine-residue succinyltransferase [Geminicoccaceae bacterium SCSIO 64248]
MRRETVEIRVPTLGESVTEATVARWFKAAGDQVAADEPLLELETDKVSLEVPAPAAGVLSEIAVEEGAEVEVGAVLGMIEEGGQAAPAPKAEPAKAADTKEETPAGDGAPADAAGDKPAAEAKPAAGEPGKQAGPAARKAAAESGVDIASIQGTGPKGNVTKADVKAQPAPVEAKASEPKPEKAPTPFPAGQAGGGREERVRMTRLRKRVAERLKEAQNTAAMLTTFNEVDMSALMNLRKRWQDDFVKKHGTKLGFMSPFVKASIEALKAFPAANAEIDGDEIVYKYYYDIGIAVSTDTGLVVPVLRGADRMGLADIEKGIAALGQKARGGKLAMEDLQGGTFSITNGGIFGSMLSTPILNPPQVAILGMHNIVERPVVKNGQVVTAPIMYVALSYDHRIIDGREAVSFLVRVKQCLETPERMLLDV